MFNFSVYIISQEFFNDVFTSLLPSPPWRGKYLRPYLVLFNRIYPLSPVIWILSTKIPNAIIYTYIKSTFIKIMRLWRKKQKMKSKTNFILRSVIFYSKNMYVSILAGGRLLLFFCFSSNFLKDVSDEEH